MYISFHQKDITIIVLHEGLVFWKLLEEIVKDLNCDWLWTLSMHKSVYYWDSGSDKQLHDITCLLYHYLFLSVIESLFI